MSGPSDIEMAQIKKLCAELAAVTGGHTHAVALCAIEFFVASVIVEAGIQPADLMDGVSAAVARMRARTAERGTET